MYQERQTQHRAQYRAISLLFWQYMVLGAVLGVFFVSFPCHAALCLGLLLLFLALHYQDQRFLRLLLVCMAFGAAYGYTLWREPVQESESLTYYQENFDELTPQELCGKIEQVQGAADGRLRIFLSHVHKKDTSPCLHSGENPAGKTLQGNIVFTWDNVPYNEKRPVPGQYLQVKTRLRPFPQALQQYYQRQNTWYGAWQYGRKHEVVLLGEGKYWSNIRENLRSAFVRVLFAEELQQLSQEKNFDKRVFASSLGQAKAILLALLFGDKFYLTQETINSFVEFNLSHSLALSGQHLSLAGVLASLALFFVSCFAPRVYLHIPKYHLFVYLGLVLGILYCWLGSSPYSLLRAYSMAGIAGLLYVFAKPVTLLDLLFYALALFIFFQPLSLYHLGVQLSFCCVFTIAFLLPFLRYSREKYFLEFRPIFRKMVFALFSLLLISLTVQIVMIPLLLLYFGQISYFSFLNIVWIPLLAFWVMPLALFGFLCMNFSFAPSLLALAYEPAALFIDAIQKLSDYFQLVQGIRPMGLALIGFYLLVFLLFFALRQTNRKNTIFLILALCFLLLPAGLRYLPFGEGVQVTLFDVGNGQAISIQTKEKFILLDVGGTKSRRFNVGRDLVAKKVTQNQFPAFDFIIASHDDTDHINGIAPLLQAFSVGTYYETSCAEVKTSYAKRALDEALAAHAVPVQQIGMGDYLDLGAGYGLEVLFPPKNLDNPWALAEYSSNNSSLVLRLVKNGQGIALFCGDSEEEALARLVAMQDQKIHSLQADVFILPHHGSENSYSEALYSSVNPSCVLASCAKYNHFHFPASIIRRYFAAKNIPLLTTAEEGDISFLHENGQIFLQKKTFLQACYSIL